METWPMTSIIATRYESLILHWNRLCNKLFKGRVNRIIKDDN